MPRKALPVRCHVLKEDHAKTIEDFLVKELPECYTSRMLLKIGAERTGKNPAELLANKLPDRGSVMSGEFGEVLTLFFLCGECAEGTWPVRKWRYKQDRRKPAPYSDVIILYRKSKRDPSEEDFVLCAEAKQKATSSEFCPISQAVEGFIKDRTGRLARTLVWLREKAIDREHRNTIKFLERFTHDLSVEFAKYFKAVAVIDRSLLDEEITRDLELPEQDGSFEVLVLGISDLKRLYETVFERAVEEVTVE